MSFNQFMPGADRGRFKSSDALSFTQPFLEPTYHQAVYITEFGRINLYLLNTYDAEFNLADLLTA